MAITGAYGAGFAKGFGTDFAGRIDERKKLQEKYADLMIDSAKAKAPKYAAQTAAYKSTVNQAKQLKDEFGFTDAEIVGIASKYDINKIYTDLFNQKAAAIQAGSVLGFDKGIVLNTLNLPAEASLPEGMSMEDGLRQVILNTQKNLDDSNNPQSEVSRRSAFGKAMANLLSLNPRASAEDQIKSMQIAGFSAEELMAWSPEAGRGDMFPEVTAGPLSLPGQDYKATDYESRKGQVRRDLARQFKLFNETTGDIDATMGAVFKDSGSTAIEVAQNIEDASILFADLDKKIAFKGYGAGFGDKSQRSNVLDKLRRLINTPEELAALVKLESSGKITQMILDTNGTFDEDDIVALLTGKPREDKPIDEVPDVTVDTVTPEAAQTKAAVSEAEEAVTAPNANQQAAIAQMPNGNIVSRMLEEQGITPEGLTDDAMGLPDGPVNFGLTDDDMGLPDSPVVDTLAPAISSGAAASEWLGSVNPIPSTEDLNTGLVTTNYKVASATTAGLATAIDFLTGFVGGAQETKISRDLKKLSKTQAERAAEVAALGFTKYFTSDLPPQEVVDEVKDNYVKLFTSTSDTPAYKELQQLIQDRIEYADRKRAKTPDVVQDNTDLEAAMVATDDQNKRIRDSDRQFLADERNYPQPISGFVTPAKTKEEKNLEANMIAIDEQKKRIQDMDRQFLADEKNYPQPLKAMTSIEPLSINTPAELDAAIAERVGEMPPDYKKQVVSAVASINKMLKDFEEKANITAGTVIDTVSPSNLAEAISNLTARMFDTTLEERIMNNEGQINRAAAFAKLQQQLSELTLFPERVPVDMNDIDPYPTMDQMGAQRLHSLQDDINTSILSATKKLLSRIGFGNSSSEAVEEVNPEPLVTRPKKTQKPKEMTASDKTRLRRAQKANELSGDTSLLEMLVKKYGTALVQKEMGL